MFFLIFYLRLQRCYAESGWSGGRGRALFFRKDVYLTFLSLTLQNFATSQLSQNKSNGRCLRGMLYILGMPFSTKGGLGCYTYRRGLSSALLVQTGWAMRRPCRVGRVTGTDSRAFFFIIYSFCQGNRQASFRRERDETSCRSDDKGGSGTSGTSHCMVCS